MPMKNRCGRVRSAVCLCAIALLSWAACASAAGAAPAVAGIRIEFLLFAATLLGVALLHDHTLGVGLTGLAVITGYELLYAGFHEGAGWSGLWSHAHHEWVIVANLFALLVGFAALSKHFEDSHVPALLPRLLPDDWTGALALLGLVFVLSSFLDNIAAALIGGTVAATVFRGRVHVGYLAAIVGAANAGGAGSVVGDTTTTMMWIGGVHPFDVLHAYVAAVVALAVLGIPASLMQQRYSPIVADPPAGERADWTRVFIVVVILVTAIATNVIVNLRFPEHADRFPFIGAAVWVALLACAPLRAPDWKILPAAVKGSVFLLSLVLCASMMPVEELPVPSWQTALGLGYVSAVFDNIPLTKLAIDQNGYDWGMLAYTVGFGGSMIWFGSSAGVALSSYFPQARSVGDWLRHGWPVALGYIAGFIVLLLLNGWNPEPVLR
jgi:Na+/H+ antiporter NhaD/arsenite permease-like protein